MSQNPYQADDGYDPEFEMLEVPPRTSLLAVCSLLAAIPCFVPGIGLFSAVLGGVSLGLIRKADGRLSGRAAAVAGIFLGILVTVIQGALLIGITQAYTFYNKQMAPVTETFFVSAGQGDLATARSQFTADANSDFTDERLASFIQAIQESQGVITGSSSDFKQLLDSFVQVYSGSRSRNTVTVVTGNTHNADGAPVPFRIDTDTGSFVGVAVFDKDTFGTPGQLKLVDAMAILPGAKAVVLRENGPAYSFAAAVYSVMIISHTEALEPAIDGDADASDAEPSEPSEPSTPAEPEAPSPEDAR